MESISGVTYYAFVVAFIAVIAFHTIIGNSKRKHHKYPPGPSFALPLLGHLHLLGRKPHIAFQKWRKLYGPVFSLKLGGDNAVVISDAKLLKQVFSNPAANGRIRNPVMDVFGEGRYGLGNLHDENWVHQRRFTVKTLNTLGLAKGGVLEGIIADEAVRLVKFFGKRVGLPISGNGVFNGAAVNSVWTMTTGERNAWDGPELPESLRKLANFMRAINTAVETGLMFFPWLRFIVPKLSGWRDFVASCKSANQLSSEIIDEHDKSRGISNDFIEHYLAEIECTADPSSGFYGDTGRSNLRVILVELILAGSETVATTMEYVLVYLSKYKHVQKQLQSELDREIGKHFPTLSDRPRLPYTEAFILETLRRSSIVGMGVPHRTLEDIQLDNYTIPMDTIIMGDMVNIHHSPEIWGQDSYDFRPERFLSEDKSRVVHQPDLMPFSTGSRMCIGEGLANDTLFLFVTSLMQQFNVQLTDDKLDLNDVVPGLVLKPKDFQVILNERNK